MNAAKIIGALGLVLSGICARSQQAPKYLDPSVPIEQRIDDLLPRMTLEEKIAEISNDKGSVPIPRLHIPVMFKTEALHGQATSMGATIFPQAIALAGTFDPGLMQRVATVAGVESKAANLTFAWAPVLNLARDVRWGRVEETYGESPYLASQMGVAWINGYQSQGLIAVAKHYAAHGAPLGGRDSNDVGYSDRMLREIFLPAFRDAIEKAHAGGIMPAYSSWQGIPDNASTTLLQNILRQEWGFNGIVVSDCGAIENFYQKQAVAHTLAEAAALGIKAGVNLNCGATYRNWAAIALQQGLITPEELDNAVRPMLRAKFTLGLFEHPLGASIQTGKLASMDTPAARALAREAAVESAVLLKNDASILPLRKDIATIAVIGPDAEVGQTGDYTPKLADGQVVSVLEGIRSHVSAQTTVLFARGLEKASSTDTSGFAEAVATANKADVVVLVIGDNSRPHGGKLTTGEGFDSATLDFPGAQRDLVRAIAATAKPIVLVLANGKPFTLAWEAEHIPAILETWFPGEEGGNATADLLFGDHNPSGRLPVTWPRSAGQLPLNYDYLPSGRGYDYADLSASPQWKFGFGLSYTQFRYSHLRILPRDANPASVDITAEVENVGSRDGDEVSQLYLTHVVSSVLTPIVELKGFERIHLKAGETRTVNFHLDPYDLSILDADMVRRVEPGLLRVHVGALVPDAARLQRQNDDRLQERVGFNDSMQGVSAEFTEPAAYSAKFAYTLQVPPQVTAGRTFAATVTVRNNGNLTDVTEAKLDADVQLGAWNFEVNPGESKSHTFNVTLSRSGSLVLVAGTQAIVQHVAVRSPAQSHH